MNIIPKHDLVNGAYYEGIGAERGETLVGRWNAKENLFESVLHYWSGELIVCLRYWDEINEYYEAFQPLLLVEPREFEKVENY